MKAIHKAHIYAILPVIIIIALCLGLSSCGGTPLAYNTPGELPEGTVSLLLVGAGEDKAAKCRYAELYAVDENGEIITGDTGISGETGETGDTGNTGNTGESGDNSVTTADASAAVCFRFKLADGFTGDFQEPGVVGARSRRTYYGGSEFCDDYWTAAAEYGISELCEFDFEGDALILLRGSDPYDGVDVTGGGTVTGEVKAEPAALEINQALSYGLDEDTGELYMMDSFVAGKTTAVIARFDEPAEAEGYTLTVSHGSDAVYELSPDCVTDDGTGLIFTVAASALEAGDYDFSVGSVSRSAYFAETKTLRLLLVPIKGNYGGEVTEPEDGWQSFAWHLSACYPIAEANITVDTGAELDLSDDIYDLYTNDGQYNVWYELAQLQTGGENEYDLILGFVSGMMGEAQNIGGYTYGLPANIINAASDCPEAVVSHEVAHCYLVGDEYEGGAFNLDVNMAPYGNTGAFWYDRSLDVAADNEYVEQAYDYELYCSGSAIPHRQIPYDAANRRQYDNAASIMCGCSEITSNYWITSDIWEQLYKAFTVRDYSVETGFNGGVIQTSSGTLELFCESCLHSYPLSEVEYYGYCESCWAVTKIDPNAERVEFDCESCGAHNVDTPVYLCCPFEYCGKFLRVEPLEPGEEEIVAFGSSEGVGSLASEPEVDVLYVTGIVHKGGDTGDTFELLGAEKGRAHIDTVDISKNDGSCALFIENADSFFTSCFYFEPDYWANGEPPVERDIAYVSFTLRLPANAENLLFYHTIPGNDEREGWMEYGGFKTALNQR